MSQIEIRRVALLAAEERLAAAMVRTVDGSRALLAAQDLVAQMEDLVARMEAVKKALEEHQLLELAAVQKAIHELGEAET